MTIEPAPADGALDLVGGRVEVRFDVPMTPGARTRTTTTSVCDAPVRIRSHWEDDHTFVLQVSRALVGGERVRIEIDRVFDAAGRPVTTPIRLVYVGADGAP